MGSGEADAIRTSLDSVTNTVHTVNIDTGSNTGGTYGYYGWGSTTPYVWSYTTTVYKYQVKCPVKLCKKMNWLELDKITPCSKCGAKLKAVSEQADFEIEVEQERSIVVIISVSKTEDEGSNPSGPAKKGSAPISEKVIYSLTRIDIISKCTFNYS